MLQSMRKPTLERNYNMKRFALADFTGATAVKTHSKQMADKNDMRNLGYRAPLVILTNVAEANESLHRVSDVTCKYPL